MLDTLSRDDDDEAPRAAAGAAPQLFVIAECDDPAAGPARHLLADVDRVELGRAATRTSVYAVAGDLRVLRIGVPDPRMSDPHAAIHRRGASWVIEDAGAKNGVLVDGERTPRATLTDGSVLELGHTLWLFRTAEVAPATPADAPATFVASLARTLADLAVVARTPAAILVHGETGTGKEVVARAAHRLSGRGGPFVAVNCGALPEALVESELYGHRRGAFSGADADRPGHVRSADRGTLFLDEIADLPLAAQAALLRVLQEREVVPVGATQPIRVDVQVIAASHADLATRVERGAFRRDLYARLAGFTVRLPPLRDRREDLGLLLAALLPAPARLSCAAVRALLAYAWPLNIRELATALTVASALARGGPIKLAHLPAPVRAALDDPPAGAPRDPGDPTERAALVALLQAHAGNVSAIARATGKARTQVHRWLRRHALDPAQFR